MKLIILAAGNGSRFYPLTETIPKALVPLNNEPLIKHVLAPFIPHISEVICVINNETGEKLTEFLGTNYKQIPVQYVIQDKTKGKGTMHALLTAKHLVDDELFCVCNSDDLFNPSEINDLFSKPVIPGIGITKKAMPKNYLEIQHKNNYVLGSSEQTTDGPIPISNGIYFLNKTIFNFEPQSVNGDEHGLPQTLFKNLDTYPLYVYYINHWQPVNNQDELKQGEEFIKKHHMI